MRLDIKNRAELWEALNSRCELECEGARVRWHAINGPEVKCGSLWEKWDVVYQDGDDWRTVEPEVAPPAGPSVPVAELLRLMGVMTECKYPDSEWWRNELGRLCDKYGGGK